MTRERPRPAGPARLPDHWAQRLRRHLGWVVAAKLVLIVLLFLFFFSASHRPEIDADGVFHHLQLAR